VARKREDVLEKYLYLGQLKDKMNLNSPPILQLRCDRKSWKTACTLALICLVQVMDPNDDGELARA